MVRKDKQTTIVISGGFDPMHIGHLRMIKEARSLAHNLVIILNNDNWLKAKKGYCFMSENDRKEILEEIKGVDKVILTSHKENTKDMSICEELKSLHPTFFANGGDRKADNIPEYEVCLNLDIEMIFNIGGEKIRSSSELVKNAEASKHGR